MKIKPPAPFRADASVTQLRPAPRVPVRTVPSTTPALSAPPAPAAGVTQVVLDARTPLPRARLQEIWASTASGAAWDKLLDEAGAASALGAGALSLRDAHRHGARALFGAASTKPVSYVAVKNALQARGMFAEWRAMMDALPAPTRERLLEGTLTPRALFDAWAVERASWRWGSRPLTLTSVRESLTLEGRLGELERALSVMTPGQRARLEAGVMKPRELSDVLDDARSRQADVIIIGAGMAGMAAAQELMAKGLSVVVLEASASLGGRLRDGDVGGQRFDAGAAWIHATDENPLTPLVRQRGFALVAHDAPLQGFGGKGTPDEQGIAIGEAIEKAQHALEQAAAAGVDTAAGGVLRHGTATTASWQVHAANSVGPLTMGVDIDQVSTLDAGSAPAEEHGANTTATPDQFVAEGLNAVVTSFSHGVPIRLSTPVSEVRWGDQGVEVRAGGVSYRGKKVLVTTSTGALASGKIAFDPPLPSWKTEAIKALPMATYDKIAVRFDKDVFTAKGTKAGAFVYELDDEHPIDVLVRPMGKDLVVGLVGGSYADGLAQRGEDAMVEALLQKLERIYGKEVREHAVASEVTSWRSDPWALGSFTAAKPGYARMREKLRRPVGSSGTPTVFFAGEATSLKWNGMAPGAFITGQQAAQSIARGLAHAQQKLTTLRSPAPHHEAASP